MIVSESFKICICRASVPLNSTIRRFPKKILLIVRDHGVLLSISFSKGNGISENPCENRKGSPTKREALPFLEKNLGDQTNCLY
jgi:hypothetical protein